VRSGWMSKTRYLKSNQFKVKIKVSGWDHEPTLQEFYDGLLKAYPSYTDNTVGIEVLQPSGGRLNELIHTIKQNGVDELQLYTYDEKTKAEKIIFFCYVLGKMVDHQINFDNEMVEEMSHSFTLQFHDVIHASIDETVIEPETIILKKP